MGGGQSKNAPSMLDKEWRTVNWGDKQELLNLVKGFRPSVDGVKHVRILLYGPVGSGKSSYVNSVSTVVLGRSSIPAEANATTDFAKSFTVEYKTHKIKKGAPTEYYPFVFNDVMGLESSAEGVRAEDIILAMKGHVRDGYKFNPVSSLTENNSDFYNPSPSADDKVHLLVCVLNSNSPDIRESVLQKMREIREAARDLGIPQVAVATHIDQIHEEVDKDVKNVYRSNVLKKKMEEFSSIVGIPMNCIFALKNYWIDVEPDDDMDTLILSALKHMLNYADDFLDTLESA